jgi:hypothetical protein
MSEEKDKSKGYTCDCCGLFVKSYRRSFNSNMGIAILTLYKYGEGKYQHMEELLQSKGLKRCGDFSYLRFYGLIEKLEAKRNDGSSRNGKYKITGRGTAFAECKLTVQKHFIIFNNTLEGFSGEEITVKDALGEKFNYEQLMQEQSIPVKAHTRGLKKDNTSSILKPLF